LGIIQVQFYFCEEKRYKEDFVVKACGRVIDCGRGLFTPTTLGAKAGSLACRPDGVAYSPSEFVVFVQKGSADRFWNNLPRYL
jgi:hypothetical protein